MESNKILIVDDDRNICRLIAMYLNNAGYNTVSCHDGSSALDAIRVSHYDLVLLDLMIPSINGWEVCRMIKSEHNIPIIMVTARDMIDDKLSGFDAGADDYLVKPFEPKELIARVKARLKSHALSETTECEFIEALELENLRVDLNQYEVWLDGKLVDLKPKEIQLLFFLLKNRNIVFTRDQLLENIWNNPYDTDTRTVDVHIKNLRQKLKSDRATWRITTIWGVGYKLEVPLHV
jgi:DNA-binding response OmpR family regulator